MKNREEGDCPTYSLFYAKVQLCSKNNFSPCSKHFGVHSHINKKQELHHPHQIIHSIHSKKTLRTKQSAKRFFGFDNHHKATTRLCCDILFHTPNLTV